MDIFHSDKVGEPQFSGLSPLSLDVKFQALRMAFPVDGHQAVGVEVRVARVVELAAKTGYRRYTRTIPFYASGGISR